MEPEWLKFKKYPHIGLPLNKKKDSGWIINYVTNPKKISTHKFTPLLHKKIYKRKFRPNQNAPKNKFGKRVRSVQKRKERPIFYASHLDSIVYSYYSYLLTHAYEKFLSGKPFANSAVAYRKIPIDKSSKSNKCNIEFAFEAFQFIENNKHRKLSMIVSDVTSFFDNLDHRLLHKQWKKVLNMKNLPEDHYNIYKSLISKRYVEEFQLFKKFQNNLIVERGVENDNTKTVYKKKRVNKIWNLKNEQVVAFCSKEDFFKYGKKLIVSKKKCSHQHKICRKNCQPKGIPQGTPISATLANVYMVDFDQRIFFEVEARNGFYQRYSDDLIIICDQKEEAFFFDLIQNEIENLARLDIQREKTNIYRYEEKNGAFKGGIVVNNLVSANKQLEYLGFSYDGSKVRVKTVGFSKYYRGMKRAFRRGVHFASKPENKNHNLFESRLYKRFTYRGAKRKLIFKPDPSNRKKFIRTTEQDWGNYISYLEKSNRVMNEINRDNTIKRQYSKFWSNFNLLMKKSYQEIGRKVSKFQ